MWNKKHEQKLKIPLINHVLYVAIYQSFFTNHFLPIDAMAIFLSIGTIVILPITAGLLFNHSLDSRFPIID